MIFFSSLLLTWNVRSRHHVALSSLLCSSNLFESFFFFISNYVKFFCSFFLLRLNCSLLLLPRNVLSRHHVPLFVSLFLFSEGTFLFFLLSFFCSFFHDTVKLLFIVTLQECSFKTSRYTFFRYVLIF